MVEIEETKYGISDSVLQHLLFFPELRLSYYSRNPQLPKVALSGDVILVFVCAGSEFYTEKNYSPFTISFLAR